MNVSKISQQNNSERVTNENNQEKLTKDIYLQMKDRNWNWVEIKDDARQTYNTNSQITFKASMLRLSLRDYSNADIHVKGTIIFEGEAGNNPKNNGKKVVFKNCASFNNCISEIKNKQIDNAKYIDIIMPLYNLIDYSNSYSKTPGKLWNYCMMNQHWPMLVLSLIFTLLIIVIGFNLSKK